MKRRKIICLLLLSVIICCTINSDIKYNYNKNVSQPNLVINNIDFYSKNEFLFTSFDGIYLYNIEKNNFEKIFGDKLSFFDAAMNYYKNLIIYIYGYNDNSYIFKYDINKKEKSVIKELVENNKIFKNISWLNSDEFLYISNDTENNINGMGGSKNGQYRYIQNLYKFNLLKNENVLIKEDLVQYVHDKKNGRIIYLRSNNSNSELFELFLDKQEDKKIIELKNDIELKCSTDEEIIIKMNNKFYSIQKNNKIIEITDKEFADSSLIIFSSDYSRVLIFKNKFKLLLLGEKIN